MSMSMKLQNYQKMIKNHLFWWNTLKKDSDYTVDACSCVLVFQLILVLVSYLYHLKYVCLIFLCGTLIYFAIPDPTVPEVRQNRKGLTGPDFLDAFSHLYKRVCPSVRRSVGPSVTHELNFREIAQIRTK